jgi:hypothetical protein
MFKRILPEKIKEKTSAVYEKIPLGNPKDDAMCSCLIVSSLIQVFVWNRANLPIPFSSFMANESIVLLLQCLINLLSLAFLLPDFKKTVYFCFWPSRTI